MNSLSTELCRWLLLSFDTSLSLPMFVPFRPRQGAFARHCDGRTGCGVLRVVYASKPPGGVRATPPFRHYERNLRTQQCETCEHRPFATLNGFAKASSEPKNRRGGAPRGERPRRADCVSGLRGTQGRAISPCGRTLFARRRVPLHPSACRRSAPSFCVRDIMAKLGGDMPRENGNACLDS
jgi:hypothetical protein